MEMEDKFGCIENWTCNDVATWLQEKGFGQYSELFTETHRIDGRALLCITEQDLRQPPLQLLVLGDIKNLALHIQELRSYTIQPLPNLARESYSNVVLEGRSREKRLFQSTNPLSYQRVPSRQDSTESEDIDSMLASNIHIQRRMKPTESNGSILDIPPELWKTILSFFYVFAVFMVTAFVMVVVHDRVPEMDKYPPLPDLFLDNMPHVPWAFEACELVGLVLAAMWFTLLFFHKYRFILMRRMFSLTGTIFLLRCVTMLITSLSVPGRHLQCTKRYGDWYTRFERTFQIWKGMGMSLQGVRSCGDYMFSGHTSVITLLNFFVTEYTPRKYYYVHIVSWVLNFFGIFFLLAAHEHYSIDVFMAFYLSSRLFMYYHTLANNRALMAADAKRTRVWFPLFAFFESKCEGRVPNQFEFPLKHIIPSLKIFLCNLKETASNKWSSTGNINDGLGSGETHEAKQD